MTDSQIVAIVRQIRRHWMQPDSRLRQIIADALIARLEDAGVTEADIDRLFPPLHPPPPPRPEQPRLPTPALRRLTLRYPQQPGQLREIHIAPILNPPRLPVGAIGVEVGRRLAEHRLR